MEFFGESANDLFQSLCNHIVVNGDESSPRNMKIKELNNCSLVLTNPYLNVVYNKHRKINLKYLVAELFWYMSGDQTKKGSQFISNHASFWKTIINKDGSLNSNYGHYLFNTMDKVLPTEEEYLPISDYYFSKSQFDWIIDILHKDSHSRQAVVNINNIYHKSKPTKDFPCTVAMQFFIRNYKLHMTVTMRSTDLVLGFCNDIFQFTNIQMMVLNKLKELDVDVSMGIFTLFTTSLHVYEKHYKMIETVIKEPEYEPYKDRISTYKDLNVSDIKHILSSIDKHKIQNQELLSNCAKDYLAIYGVK